MYNYPKLGSLLEIRPRVRRSDVTKKYARDLYPDAENVLLLDGEVFFNVIVTYTDKTSLMPEPMPIAVASFCVKQDATTKAKLSFDSFTKETLVNPDYNERVKVLKGSIDNFIKELS